MNEVRQKAQNAVEQAKEQKNLSKISE